MRTGSEWYKQEMKNLVTRANNTKKKLLHYDEEHEERTGITTKQIMDSLNNESY